MQFSAEKIDGEIVVKRCRGGNYRADSAEEIRRALTELKYIPPTAEVRIYKKWYPLKRVLTRSRIRMRSATPRRPHVASPESTRRGLTTKQKILKALRLYKDPLESLIYKDEKNN